MFHKLFQIKLQRNMSHQKTYIYNPIFNLYPFLLQNHFDTQHRFIIVTPILHVSRSLQVISTLTCSQPQVVQLIFNNSLNFLPHSTTNPIFVLQTKQQRVVFIIFEQMLEVIMCIKRLLSRLSYAYCII